MKTELSAQEFTAWLFPKGGANQNPPLMMASAVDHDLIALFNKWSFNGDDAANWSLFCGMICGSVAKIFTEKGCAVVPSLRSADAIWTAGTIGIAQALFYSIAQLPHPEAVYVLEEIARLTDQTVEDMKKDDKENIKNV